MTGIRHTVSDVYHAGRARYGNWYNWQIGGPQALLDTAIILYDHLDAELIATITEAVRSFVPGQRGGVLHGHLHRCQPRRPVLDDRA